MAWNLVEAPGINNSCTEADSNRCETGRSTGVADDRSMPLRKPSQTEVEAPGIEPGSGSPQSVRLRVVARGLGHPACAHEQARTELSSLCLAPCSGRFAGDQPDRLRPPVSSGRLILWTAHDCFLGSESKRVIVRTCGFQLGFARSVGPSNTQHRFRGPRRSRSPPFRWGVGSGLGTPTR